MFQSEDELINELIQRIDANAERLKKKSHEVFKYMAETNSRIVAETDSLIAHVRKINEEDKSCTVRS